MKKKQEWRRRVRGTPRQIGQAFPLMERADKRDLPTGLKIVTEPKDIEPEDIPLRDEVERLASEIDQAEETEDYERLLKLLREVEELEEQVEKLESPQGVSQEKLKGFLAKLKKRLTEKPVKEVPHRFTETREPKEEDVYFRTSYQSKPKKGARLIPVGRTKTGKIIYERIKDES